MRDFVTQKQFVDYTQYLHEVKLIEQCIRKKEVTRLGFVNGHFVKHDRAESSGTELDLDALKSRITFINAMHQKLGRDLSAPKPDDCIALVANAYNGSLKIITGWNKTFREEEMKIQLCGEENALLTPSFAEKPTAQLVDDIALARYFALLEKYPDLKRTGDLNDHTLGTYEIYYNAADIERVRNTVLHRIYDELIQKGFTPEKAQEIAVEGSRIGIVHEDRFWLWIRDAVISPHNLEHTYNRMVWKCHRDRIGGAVAFPVIEGETVKIALALIYRHATSSWEFELPRGASKKGETPDETAKREMAEEIGCAVEKCIPYGSLNPDSGLVSSTVPIYAGVVRQQVESDQEETEAIKGKYCFTIPELLEGINRGYIEVELNGRLTKIGLKDPFLSHALLMSQIRIPSDS